MTMPALKLDKERVVDRAVALEAHVGHIQADISDMKADIRRLDGKIEAIDQKFTAKFDNLKDSITALTLTTDRSFSRLTLWAIMLYVALAGGLLFVMAKGFKWI